MELIFNIATQRILRECITQTSLDLQAIRARGSELSAVADAIYVDWTMNEDNLPEIYTPLEGIGASLCKKLRNYIVGYASGVDITTIQLNVPNVYNGIDAVIDSALLHYYKYSLLEWWYSYRDADLSLYYRDLTNQAFEDIYSNVVPRCGKIIPHYF